MVIPPLLDDVERPATSLIFELSALDRGRDPQLHEMNETRSDLEMHWNLLTTAYNIAR